MEDARYSNIVPQIVKIVRMVVKFHPLLIITSLICWMIFLQDRIEEKVSNQWKALNVYYELTMRALLDSITEKMKNISEALQMHLNQEAEKGQPKTKLIGRIALLLATFLLLDTEVSSKYDKIGVKMNLLLFIGLELLRLSKRSSQFKIPRRFSCFANSTSNFTFFLLALVFAKFYDNSLRSLSSLLFIAIYLLCLLVILQPRTDLGLFNFIIGVVGSITYNLFKFSSPTWIIAFICFLLLSFKSWLDKYWLDLREDQSLNSTNIMAGSTSVPLILSSIAIHIIGALFPFSYVKPPLFDYKVWCTRVIGCVIWNIRGYKKDTSLPSTNTKRISGLILTIVTVAQGIFSFSLAFPIGDYKYWLFVVISYVVFCFWLRSFCPKDMSLPSTNTKGISSLIWYLQSVDAYGIVVLAGFESRLYYRDWLIMVTCCVLWWVRLRTSMTIEFKVLQWWQMVVYLMIREIIEVIYWTF